MDGLRRHLHVLPRYVPNVLVPDLYVLEERSGP